MYGWIAEGFSAGMDIDIEMWLSTVGTVGVPRLLALGPGACGWILMLI